MVCAMWMWGMRVGLASVMPSFTSWSTCSLPSIPVWALTFCIIILWMDHIFWWTIVEMGSLSRWFYWDDGCRM
jgi:hypothetical protein